MLNSITPKKRNQTIPQLAISWVLRHKTMTSALIGARNVKQLNAKQSIVYVDNNIININKVIKKIGKLHDSNICIFTQSIYNKISSLPMYPDEVSINSTTDRSISSEARIESLAIGKWDGDLDNWQGNLDDSEWRSITADHNECTGRKCPNISN